MNPLNKQEAAITAYLQQEGLLEDRRFGVVDVGWRGSYHAGLCQFREAHGLSPIQGFFIGIENSDGLPGSDAREALFSLEDAPSRLAGRFNASFIYFCESLFQAPHGGVASYEESNGRIIPTLDTAPPFAEEVSLREEQALNFVGRILEQNDFDLYDPILVSATRDLIIRTALQPATTEASALGKQYCEPERGESDAPYPLAPKFSCGELLKILLRRQGLNRYRRQWGRARIENSALPLRYLLRKLDRLGR